MVQQPAVPETGNPPLPNVDAKVDLFFADGDMQVDALVTAPQGEGAPVSMEMLKAALAKAGVVYGVDAQALDGLAVPLYGQRVTIAQGTPAQNGANGSVQELFAREAERKVTTREDGTVDYRELGVIRDLKVGATICEITLPTQGVDGQNTKGVTLKARNGEKAAVPMGENLAISEDGARVITAVPGNLVFRSGHFTIETVLRVQDVDYDIGNITFSGDVKVAGDVKDGFDITAGGTVVIHGQVGNCNIKAKNITLEKGVNGTGKAVMDAKAVFKAGFVENCKVMAGEKVMAQSIINSTVECEGDVEVTSGKGVISGSKVMAFGNLTVKQLGSEANTLSNVSLGVTPRLFAERKRMQGMITELERTIDELEKNAAYIERLIAKGQQVPEERVSMLKRAQIALPMSLKKKAQLEEQLAELEARMADAGNVQLVANIIYNPVKLSIGTASTNIIEVRQNARIFKNSEGEIVLGTK